MRRTLETLFERYRHTGDLVALERVFDRVAPKLLRLAAHFAPDPAAAEDLVQETFLTAIEQAERFDATRQLRPWLVGIMRNHARQGWRRRAREGALPLPPELAADARRDPIDGVEWTLAISEGVEAVAEPYRQALILRLKHGIEPADIATLLDISPATVRTRVHRGLVRLRERLPKDRTPTLIALLPIPVGLDVMRTQVLSAATTHVVAAAATASVLPVVGGILMTKKAALVAIALVVPLLAGGIAWVSGAFEPPVVPYKRDTGALGGSSEEGAQVPNLQVGGTEPVATDNTPVAKPEVAVQATMVPLDAPIPEGKGSVAGLIRFEDGTPLADTPVALWGTPMVEVRTDANGRFHIHGDWVGPRTLYINKTGEYGLGLATTQMAVDKRVTVDVTLVRGIELRARIVDEETQQPIQGVLITLRRPVKGAQADFGFAKSDAQGRFGFEYLPKTHYTLELTCKGYEGVGRKLDLTSDAPKQFTLRRARPLALQFEGPPDTVVGTKIGWSLQRIGQAFYVHGDAIVDARRRLVVDAPPPGDYMLTLYKSKALSRVERRFDIEEDTATLTIRLPPGRVEGSVGDRRGAPLVGVHVHIKNQKAKTEIDGDFALTLVEPGMHQLWLDVDGASVFLQHVEVRKSGTTSVDVRDLGASQIRGRLLVEGSPAHRRRSNIYVTRPGTNEAVATARVDKHGNFRIPYLDAGQYVVRCFSDGAETKLVEREVGDEDDQDLGTVDLALRARTPVRITLPDGVSLADVSVIGFEIPADGGLMAGQPGSKARIAMGRIEGTPTGDFVLANIPPGTYRLRVHAKGCETLEFPLTVPRAERAPLEISLVAK